MGYDNFGFKIGIEREKEFKNTDTACIILLLEETNSAYFTMASLGSLAKEERIKSGSARSKL